MKRIIFLTAIIAITASCSNRAKTKIDETPEILQTTPFDKGIPVAIHFDKGDEYYHPLIVFWIEDTEGNYVQTLYAAKSIATGTFRYGVSNGKKWSEGERRRPAALPYWGHKRGFKTPDGLYIPTPESPLPDAITGATPTNNFVINSLINPELKKFTVYMEINQTWDWNQHWHNNLYPNDDEYKTSCQPALVYMAEVDLTSTQKSYTLKPVGHSHPSGKTGELFSDLSTFTTALKIAGEVRFNIE